jgi:hypothetical protein
VRRPPRAQSAAGYMHWSCSHLAHHRKARAPLPQRMQGQTEGLTGHMGAESVASRHRPLALLTLTDSHVVACTRRTTARWAPLPQWILGLTKASTALVGGLVSPPGAAPVRRRVSVSLTDSPDSACAWRTALNALPMSRRPEAEAELRAMPSVRTKPAVAARPGAGACARASH